MNSNVAEVQVGQGVVRIFLQRILEFFLGGVQLVLHPIRNANGIVNALRIRPLGERSFVFLDSFLVAFLFGVHFSDQRMQLKRVRIKRLQSLDRLEGSVLVNARKLVEPVGVFRIFRDRPVQLRYGFIGAARELQRQSQVITATRVRICSGEFLFKAMDSLREAFRSEVGNTQEKIGFRILRVASKHSPKDLYGIGKFKLGLLQDAEAFEGLQVLRSNRQRLLVDSFCACVISRFLICACLLEQGLQVALRPGRQSSGQVEKNQQNRTKKTGHGKR